MIFFIIGQDVQYGNKVLIILKLHPIVYEYEFGRSDQPDFLEEFIDQCTNDEKVSMFVQ